MNFYYKIDISQMSPFMTVVMILWMLLLIFANCTIFMKAGEPWWKAIIPFYNTYTMFKIFTTSPLIFFILSFIPCVNVIIILYLLYQMARCFGQGLGFTLGLILLQPIFTLLLAFGDYDYTSPYHL